MATLAFHYDRVILDLAAGVDMTNMRLARQADKIAVVTTEEPTALTDAYAFIKVLRAGAPAGAAKTLPSVVVNMAAKRVEGRKIYDLLAKATESFLGVRPPLAGVIMRDPLVPEAIRAQTALAVRSPSSPALDDVIRIADALMA
jgi:flagellar biosynthesis protein FlhG